MIPSRQIRIPGRAIPAGDSFFFVYTHLGRWVDKHLLGYRIRRRDRYEAYGDFQEILAYRPGNARPHVFRLAERQKGQETRGA